MISVVNTTNHIKPWNTAAHYCPEKCRSACDGKAANFSCHKAVASVKPTVRLDSAVWEEAGNRPESSSSSIHHPNPNDVIMAPEGSELSLLWLCTYFYREVALSGRGFIFPLKGTGSSGRSFWKRCFRGWWRRCTGNLLKTKNPVMVYNEELNKCSLVTGLQQSHQRHVGRHKGAQ